LSPQQEVRMEQPTSSFSRFARSLDYPLYVVTTALGDVRSGCLIGFATQCSIHPPRFLACLSKKNHTYQLALRTGVLALHRVEQDKKQLAELFGGETGDEVDKFAQVHWHAVDGVPVLDECACWFTGKIMQRIDLGDHMGFLLQPIDTQPAGTATQLTFQQARDIKPGHKA
jgi:flavin reductase (DIM6/NTAB) family NADH-FMN oxidoreductase RutF